ncbi:hypothetical protein TNCV_3030571 [Trichonephila clavipes]|nr:hypothetical protein TNCV_3030571 [Trichonephila clavipes]
MFFPKGGNENCEGLRHRLDFNTIDGDAIYFHPHNLGMELEGSKYILQHLAPVVSAATALKTFGPTDLTGTDEAHFWLNGYVNKQNCRIWSEANPQVYVETPLHPEKLTVWCALWAGGILLQKR